MADFVSEPIPLPRMGDDLSRADLVFHGVDHSGPSFEALVFLNNPAATADTGRERAQGYVGAFFIFGLTLRALMTGLGMR